MMERCQPQADLGITCRSHPVAVSRGCQTTSASPLQNLFKLVLVVAVERAYTLMRPVSTVSFADGLTLSRSWVAVAF